MLQAVDIPVVIARPDGRLLGVPGRDDADVVTAPHPGSRGWNAFFEAIASLAEAEGPGQRDAISRTEHEG